VKERRHAPRPDENTIRQKEVRAMADKEPMGLGEIGAHVHTPESFGRALLSQVLRQASDDGGESAKLELTAEVKMMRRISGGVCVFVCICGRGWCECIFVCVFWDRPGLLE
jgi:hypothetical protein